jgi:hypothetical protein
MAPSSFACKTRRTWWGWIAGPGGHGHCKAMGSIQFIYLSPLFIVVFQWVPLSVAGRNCKYSGEPEYWVEVRESGEKGQEKETKKQRKEISQDHISVKHVFKLLYVFFPHYIADFEFQFTPSCATVQKISPFLPRAISFLSQGRWAKAWRLWHQQASGNGTSHSGFEQCWCNSDFWGAASKLAGWFLKPKLPWPTYWLLASYQVNMLILMLGFPW